jgi:hypothetical protein
MKTTNILAIVVTLVVNMFAFRASAQDAAILAGIGNSKGCFHYELDKEKDMFYIENCNGWIVAPVVAYSQVKYKSSDPGSTSSMKFGIQAGYRHNMWRPEVSVTYIPSMTIEGVKFDGYEITGALNIDLCRHEMLNVYIAPTIAGKQIECHEQVSSTMDIPYSGTAIMYGGKVGVMLKTGTFAVDKKCVMHDGHVTIKSRIQHFVKVEVGYQGGKVTEPTTSSNTGHRPTLKLNEYYASISWVVKF